MHITERFLAFTLLGAEWVLWLLIILSVISFAIMIERAYYFITHAVDVDALGSDLRRLLSKGAYAEAMVGQKPHARMLLERNLAFLGTLGNNAPFIGLFGTVLGIIKAFHDLGQVNAKGAQIQQTVMAN